MKSSLYIRTEMEKPLFVTFVHPGVRKFEDLNKIQDGRKYDKAMRKLRELYEEAMKKL